MATHGHLSYFSLEDSGGATLRNLSPYLTSVDFNQSNDTHDVTAFGAEGHTYIVGLTDGTIDLAGFYDTTALVGTTTVLQGLLGYDGNTMTFNYGPAGNGTGAYKRSGEVVLSTYAESDPVADIVTFKATLKISGSVTVGAF